jgi:hypothetical protein
MFMVEQETTNSIAFRQRRTKMSFSNYVLLLECDQVCWKVGGVQWFSRKVRGIWAVCRTHVMGLIFLYPQGNCLVSMLVMAR